VGNLTDILRQIALIGIISLAMTYVILTGGIDLSVGSILALSTAVVAMLLTTGVEGINQPSLRSFFRSWLAWPPQSSSAH